MSKCVCVLHAESGSSVSGVLILTQTSVDAPTTIHGQIKGLSPGKHGIAIHTYGDLRPTATTTTSNDIFNPFGKPHGLPQDGPNHRCVGSLGNIVTNSGSGGIGEDGDGVGAAGGSTTAIVDISDPMVQLLGPHSVVGRLLAIYASEDDGGRGGHENSSTTGNAGPRVAAGVIGIAPM